MKVNSIETILLHDWDPIGIRDVASAQDEYEAYAPKLKLLLSQRATVDVVANFLLFIEQNEMGLAGDGLRARRVAEKLLQIHPD